MGGYLIVLLILFSGPFRLEGGHLNFEQFTKLGDKLREFSTWKDVECPYQKSPLISEYLQKSPILSEEGNEK